MKKAVLIFTAVVLSITAYSQAPDFAWAGQIGGGGAQLYGITTDNAGNVYTTGFFGGTPDFDPGPGTFYITSNGPYDVYVSKLDASGNFLWAKSFGGASGDIGYSIAVDSNGNVYTTGFFQGFADFDPGPGTFYLSSSSAEQIFISKLDAAGNFVWAKQFGGTSQDMAFSIALDASGNIYTTGTFRFTVDFDPGPGTFNMIASGAVDAFINKLDASGNFVWAKRFGGVSGVGSQTIKVDALGNVYTSGYFSDSADFDPGPGTYYLAVVPPAYANDAFVSKLDASGNFVWAKKFGGTSEQIAEDMAVDPLTGNVYTIGRFAGTADFDPGVGTYNLTATTGATFISKLDASGNFAWARHIDAPSLNYGYGICLDGSENVYLTGFFQGTTDMDPGAGTFNLVSAGSDDIYIEKLDAAGNFIFAVRMGGTNSDLGRSINVDTSNNILTGGIFTGTVDFDPGAGVFNLATPQSGTKFVQKLGQCSAAPSQPGSITGNLTICQGSANSYSIATVPGATSYTWNLPAGWTGSSTTNTITATASATSGTITVTANNGCGSSLSQTLAITVNTVPAAPGSISGNSTICSGSSNTYSVTAVAGATSYTWSLPGGWTGTSTTNSISTTASATSGSITVTANNGCGASSGQTLAVTVNSIPSTPGTISGNATICSGSSNTYSVASDPSATSYTWSLPGGWTGTSTTNSISTTASAASGNITVTANNTCGSSSAQTLAVTVNSIPPTPGTISGNATICSGSSNTYSITAVAGATSYTWSLPGGWTGTSSTNSISTTASATSGNVTVTANNTCGSSSSQTLAVTVNSIPSTPGTISGNATICSGSINTYSITAIAGATSYTWSLPGGWTGTSTTNSITTTASATSGNVTVTADNTCGASSAQTLAVAVNSIPSTPGAISGNTTICSGSSNTYSVASDPSATSYTWSLPGGWTGTSTTNSITTTASATSGNITVTANNTCGSSSAQTLAVAVNSIPSTPGTISGNATICSGSSNTYSVTAVAGATSYTWTLPGGWTGTSTTNSISTTASATSGNVTVTADNTCGASSAQTLAVAVNSIPSTPGTISGNATICSGSSNTYSITAVAGATSYTWSLPGGWTGTSTTNSISTTASATSGNITVTADNTCGASSAQTLAVTVNSIPSTPGTISGNATICSGSSNTYSVTAVAGATSYTWSLPGGWTGTSTANSISTTASATNGNITVTANNTCGASSAQTLAVTVNSIPSTPGTISGNATICSGSSNTYSVTAIAGATSYTWSLPGGWTGTSTTNSITTTASATSGNITVTADNTCGASSAQTLAVTVNSIPPTPGTISGNATICSGSSNTYSITAVAGATSYTWSLPGGWTGTSTTNSISTTASATSGNITVTANNTCGSSSSQTLAVTVNSIPSTPGTISGNATICSGSSNTYSITAVAGATSYTWSLPGGWTGTSSTNSISTTASATNGNVTVTANNTCGSSSSQTLAVTVNSIPSTPGTISGNATICSGSSNTYSVTAIAGATSYTWSLPGGWTGTSTTNSITTTASATSGNITVTANNTCGSSSAQTLAVAVNSIPSTPGTISGNATICSGSSNTYSVTAVAGATSYTWTLPGGWTGTSTTNSISTTASATSGNVTVTADNTCGASSAQTLAVAVNSIPSTPGTISGNTTICSGSSNTYSVASDPSATSYTWTLPGGWTGTSTTNSIATTASATSGNITVTADNTCGSSSVQTLAVTVNSIPSTPGTIAGSTTICSGSSNTYSVASDPSATSYTWSLPGGWTGTSTINSITTIASATSGNITVTADNACGSSPQQTLAITVNTVPAVPGIISGNTSVCTGSNNTYSVTNDTSALSYTWSLPGGWTGTSTSSSINATVSSVSGNITVTANNSCGSSAQQTLAVTVNALPNVSVTLPLDTLCVNSAAVTLSGGSPAGGVYSGINVSSGSFNPASTGNFLITYTVTDTNSCTDSATTTIVVDACLGINENEADLFSVYPNPTNGMVSITSQGTTGQVTIYNATGEMIRVQSLTSGKTEIDLSHCADGIYFVQVQVGSAIITKKIIKE